MDNVFPNSFAELSVDELYSMDGGESPAYYAGYVVGALLGIAYDVWYVYTLL